MQLQGPWRRARTGTDHLIPKQLISSIPTVQKGSSPSQKIVFKVFMMSPTYILWFVVPRRLKKKPSKLASLRFLRDRDLSRLLFSFSIGFPTDALITIMCKLLVFVIRDSYILGNIPRVLLHAPLPSLKSLNRNENHHRLLLHYCVSFSCREFVLRKYFGDKVGVIWGPHPAVKA